jgi:2-hydroxychromene-2-carboxylate isomerase
MSPTVAFYFDPVCPWTWNTSRWLVEVAEAKGFTVAWRTFSLAMANEGAEVPEQYRAAHAASRGVLRIIEALRADGDNDGIGRLYLEIGRRWHHDGAGFGEDVVGAAISAAGLDGHAKDAEDESWDGALRASLAEALDLAGPGVGSPILRLDDRAMFGPIISPPPTGAPALALWDAVTVLVSAAGVYEMKRGRRSGVEAGARP